jgi:hypothetical protein
MKRCFLLLLLAGCAPTRPLTPQERAARWELPPPREQPLNNFLHGEPRQQVEREHHEPRQQAQRDHHPSSL